VEERDKGKREGKNKVEVRERTEKEKGERGGSRRKGGEGREVE